MNRIVMQLRKIRLSFTLASGICIALGLAFLLIPDTSRRLLCMLTGTGAAVYGLSSIISFLLSRRENAYPPALLSGVAALAFGVFALISESFLMDFLFVVLGIIVAVFSIAGVRRALRLRSFGFARWQTALSASLVTLCIALSVVFFPGLYGNLLMTVCGALLLTGGVCDLISLYYIERYQH